MTRFAITPPPPTSLPIRASALVFPVRRVYCVGRNYAAHAVEMGHDPDREPPFFFQKNPDDLNPTGEFPYPRQSSDVHHEAEVAVFLKSGGSDIPLDSALKFKDGDEGRFIFHAETTDKILIFGSNGRFYTLSASQLPGGRGMGEPVRLSVDLPNEAAIVTLMIHRPGAKLLVASSAGDGFLVPMDEVVAQTRAGKQVLNVRAPARANVCIPAAGDHVAVVGENRKMLVFPLEELPEMARGKGVRLQKYKDGGLSDATTFVLEEGLSWLDPAGRTRTERDLADWTAKRAGAGRMAPRGFPRDNRFT